jgi:hypothetical protein
MRVILINEGSRLDDPMLFGQEWLLVLQDLLDLGKYFPACSPHKPARLSGTDLRSHAGQFGPRKPLALHGACPLYPFVRQLVRGRVSIHF